MARNAISEVANGSPAFPFSNSCELLKKFDFYPPTCSGGVFLSTDNGASWMDISTELHSLGINALAFNRLYFSPEHRQENRGASGGGRSPKLSPLSSNLSDRRLLRLSCRRTLNPFSPSTTIWFSASRSEHVRITLYNLVGEKVAALVSRRFDAGRHEVKWDSQGFTGGLYFCTMPAGEFIQSFKLTLMK